MPPSRRRAAGEVVSFHGCDECEHQAKIATINANGTMDVIKLSTGTNRVVKPDQNGQLVEVVDSALDEPQVDDPEPEPADADDAEEGPSAEAPVQAPAPNVQVSPASLLMAVSEDSEAGTLFPARELVSARDLLSAFSSEKGPSDA